ncbi:hypothetical protein KSP40_PGU006112 [Platanthera guangdongensis]|uniref:Uncharacterized protein n=1 Tax=Platanthera guangdongensis TaxID=2320717 RepID=A0ABR2M7N8_9ASPA
MLLKKILPSTSMESHRLVERRINDVNDGRNLESFSDSPPPDDEVEDNNQNDDYLSDSLNGCREESENDEVEEGYHNAVYVKDSSNPASGGRLGLSPRDHDEVQDERNYNPEENRGSSESMDSDSDDDEINENDVQMELIRSTSEKWRPDDDGAGGRLPPVHKKGGREEWSATERPPGGWVTSGGPLRGPATARPPGSERSWPAFAMTDHNEAGQIRAPWPVVARPPISKRLKRGREAADPDWAARHRRLAAAPLCAGSGTR